ncbi:hypothetical protein [Actinoplanes sp. TBRC 11911]|nr:hypothetical protein [Actinoplanes sp. TBRC 11911]
MIDSAEIASGQVVEAKQETVWNDGNGLLPNVGDWRMTSEV